MTSVRAFVLLAVIVGCLGQRSPYAGRDPIGYPKVEVTTPQGGLGNRFGENGTIITTTTQRLPLEALGDRELVDRLGKLPEDNRPFWLINWQKLEEQRRGPQTFDQKPNIFAQDFRPQQNAQPNTF